MAKKNETKLNAAFAKQLKSMGFNCKTEEDARKQLLAALEKEGIDGMEDESLQTLIDMVSGWREAEEPEEDEVDDTEEEEEVDEDEQDAENLADEVEGEDAAEEESAEEEAEDNEEADEVEEAEEEPEEEEKPAKKAPKKSAPKKSAEPKKKKEKKETATKKKRSKLNPKDDPEAQKELISQFEKMFPKGTYLYTFVVSSGMSVKYIGSNTKRGVFLFDNLTRHEDGTITGELYLNTMTKETDKLDELGIDYQLCWTKAPFIKGVTIEEAKEILEKVFDIITSFVNKVDKRLGDNRKKMEESLEKSGKKSEKPASKKKAEKPAPEVDANDEEEDDEVQQQEAKKPAKKSAAKKTKK